MINNIYDLLNKLKDIGVKDIEKYLFVKHGPMIGNMYEGLTKKIMEKAIFTNLDLRVCSGKITNSKGELSKQIDCMIVIGKGEKLPYSLEYIYDINKVIMVIEVKKNLFSKDLDSAYQNLLSVKNITETNRDMKIDILEVAYKSIYGQMLPNFDDVKNLKEETQILYHALVVESYLPIRAVFGYDGFKTESNLRKAFIHYISNNSSNKGFGITSLPSLIVCGENSLIKTNGIPYALPTDTKKWIAYASYFTKPLILLLELLWTRLYYLFDSLDNSIFGYDNIIENLTPLIVAEGHTVGWEYTIVSEEIDREYSVWEPEEVSLSEYAIVNLLCKDREIRIDDEGVIEYCLEHNTTVEDVIYNLNNKRIACVENEELVLLTKECLCMMKNQRYYVGDDCNKQMSRWISKSIC
ncbi:MAG: hypothetical protein ACI8WT_002262 [Clostridium sp.]|jgi:hypothetical protein